MFVGAGMRARRWVAVAVLSIAPACLGSGLVWPGLAWADAEQEALVAASKTEEGVVIYSVIASSNWAEALAGFHARYPWIKVETLDLSNEIWDRYYTERSTGARTADMIVAFGVDRWLEFLAKGEAVDYTPPEVRGLADWVHPEPGLFSLSVDPVLIIWNKPLMKGAEIDGMQALAAAAAARPDWRGRLGTYDAGAGSLTAIFSAGWAEERGAESWPILEALGPMSKVERSGGTLTEKTLNGEYVAAYLVGGAAFYPRMLRDAAVRATLGWSFLKDGQPLFPRGIAITAGARSPASAKLLLDYALSHEGQVAFGKGGLTPVREDIAPGEIPIPTVAEIKDAVGAEDFHVLGYERSFVEGLGPFVTRWRQAYGR